MNKLEAELVAAIAKCNKAMEELTRTLGRFTTAMNASADGLTKLATVKED